MFDISFYRIINNFILDFGINAYIHLKHNAIFKYKYYLPPRRDCNDISIALTSYMADHFSFKISKHMLPLSKSTLGWKHGVKNVTVGGL